MTGQARSPVPRLVEAAATGIVGGVLGHLATRPLKLGTAGAAVGALNGLLGGGRGVYDWKSARGRTAFLLDSTWGIVGTAGALVVHAVNAVVGGEYVPALSRRRGYHVYVGGLRVRRGFTTAIGNAITSADGGGGAAALDPSSERGRRRIRLVERHEALHVWQSRSFGPLFPVLYGAWLVGGALVAVALWSARRGRRLFPIVETVAYYDNPFEWWAYKRDSNWPPSGADPSFVWRSRAKENARRSDAE